MGDEQQTGSVRWLHLHIKCLVDIGEETEVKCLHLYLERKDLEEEQKER